MKDTPIILLSAALLLLPISAASPEADWPTQQQGAGLLLDAPQQLPEPSAPGASPEVPVPGDLVGETPGPVITAPAPTASGDATAQLSPVEQHLARGIALLLKLEQVMASVDSPESAQRAVQPIGLITAELSKWPQGFLTLPPPDEEQRLEYEDRYLPVIRRINKRIQLQGERLASAQYYGSQQLAASLVRLVLSLQQ